MEWLTILLISIAANIDNLGISVSYGLKANRIPFTTNIIIAIISAICTFISITAGQLLSNYLSNSTANFVGGFLIVCLGLWIIITSKNKVPSRVINIGWKESIFLGSLLGLNCLTIGFGAGITGIPPLYASLSIGLFSIISISIGITIGNKIGNTLFGKYSNSFAGSLLIFIGFYEIFI
ncbi:manganese efflux pump [Sporosarcina sp. 6E9]|uniref:manganese efflux pump MntP n=1 Tax=Sporosarcina sp. 6E9 TaxID=2819235 RepID=UPI001B305EDE|nr:manganese efflux pump [Sporosarcina sp. 6E9]